jgi:hypothetical protein
MEYYDRHPSFAKVMVKMNLAILSGLEIERPVMVTPFRKHFRKEAWNNIILPARVRELRSKVTPWMVTKPNCLGQAVCKYLEHWGLLVNEKTVINRMMYLEHIKSIIEEPPNPLDSEIEYSDSKEPDRIEVLKYLSEDLPDIPVGEYELAAKSFWQSCMDDSLGRAQFKEAYYLKEEYLINLFREDPLRIPWIGKKFIFDPTIPEKAWRVLRLATDEKESILSRGFYSGLYHPDLSIKDIVEDDDIIVAQAKGLRNKIIVLRTNDIKLCFRVVHETRPNRNIYIRLPAECERTASLNEMIYKVIPSARWDPNIIFLTDTGSISFAQAMNYGKLQRGDPRKRLLVMQELPREPPAEWPSGFIFK